MLFTEVRKRRKKISSKEGEGERTTALGRRCKTNIYLHVGEERKKERFLGPISHRRQGAK